MHKQRTVVLVAALGLSFSTAGHAQSGASYALNFDATDAFVEISHVGALDAFPLTVTAWLNTTNRQNPSRLGVVNKYFASSDNGYILLLDQGHIHAYYFRDSANYVYTPTDGLDGGDVADGLWHHVAFTVDGSGGDLYVDGSLMQSLPWTGVPGATTTTLPLRFGLYPGVHGYPSNYVGQLAEVQLWNVARSQVEIQAGMNRILTGTEPNLVAYYQFKEGAGSTTSDSATNLGGANTGVLWNGVGWVPLGAPSLTISPDTSGAILSWRAPAVGFTLEQTPSLIAPSFWSTSATPVYVLGGQIWITNGLTAQPKFFRLIRP